MRQLIWILLAIALIPATALTQALPDNPSPPPSGPTDWFRVKDLANGEGITVARPGHLSVPCQFAGATNDYLFCDSRFTGREYRFARTEIERVRRDDKGRNMRILVGSFAAAGLIAGAALPPDNGTPRFINALAGAGVGALAGCAVALPTAWLIPGRLVYRHRQDRNATPSGLTAGPSE